MASNFWLGSAADGIAKGLRQLGWDICYVEMAHHFLHSRLLSLRLLSRGLRRWSIASYNQAVLEAVENLRPRAFLTVKGSYLTTRTLAEIRRRGITTLLYYTDFHFDHVDVSRDTFAHYDHVFTNNSLVIPSLEEQLGASRVSLLYFGYSAHVHYPRLARVAETDYLADCGYVGNCTPYKARWLEAIARKLPEVRLTIIGNGWSQAAKGTALQPSVAGFQLVGDCYSRFLQQARINLAFHMGPAGKHGWEDRISMRTFEIPACKGFMLHIDNDEIRRLFEPGKEVDVFTTADELCDKIRHYLPRPAERGEMIERAYRRCVPAYSYDVRAQAIARAIECGSPPAPGQADPLAAGV
ncbi:MAG: glycosyltransferase [Bauldia sp.]